MNKKFFILTFAILITFLILFQLYGAIQINTFDNLLTSENLTFTSATNITRYFKVPENATVISATLDLKGYLGITVTGSAYQQTKFYTR